MSSQSQNGLSAAKIDARSRVVNIESDQEGVVKRAKREKYSLELTHNN